MYKADSTHNEVSSKRTMPLEDSPALYTDTMRPSPATLPHPELDLKEIYTNRFAGSEIYRDKVWNILTGSFFSRWVLPSHSILDLGCGYGEFINNVRASKKYGMDLNPASRERVGSDVTLFHQDCTKQWPMSENALDVVFTSNFFEHLLTKDDLRSTLAEIFRCLKPGGRVLALGPNIKYLNGQYWDFFDHHIALTELSLSEAMQVMGFEVDYCLPRFLPYSMSQGFQPPLWLVRAYLQMPPVWRFVGRQFLVIGKKPA